MAPCPPGKRRHVIHARRLGLAAARSNRSDLPYSRCRAEVKKGQVSCASFIRSKEHDKCYGTYYVVDSAFDQEVDDDTKGIVSHAKSAGGRHTWGWHLGSVAFHAFST